MREIKFRAWNTRTNEMTDYAVGLYRKGGENVPWVYLGHIKGGFYKGHEIIWLQYTGFKDRNSREIYEGDVVTIAPHMEGGEYVQEKGLNTYHEEVKYEKWYYSPFDEENMIYPENCEIIGNIYETPNLL